MLKATIAHRTVVLDGCDTMIHADKFSLFVGDDAAVDQHITVCEDAAITCPSESPDGHDGMVNWYILPGGDMLLCHRQGCFSLRTTPDFSDVTLRLRPAFSEREVLQYLYVSQCIAYRALACGAIGFHGAGIGFDAANGVILAGDSGTGKSTLTDQLTALDPTVTVLNEETVIVTKEDGGYRVHGTPLCGQDERFAAGSLPLKAIVLLGRGETERFEKAPSAKAMFGLLGAALHPIYQKTLCETAVDYVTQLMKDVPVYVFEHTAGCDAGRVLKEALTDAGRIERKE